MGYSPRSRIACRAVTPAGTAGAAGRVGAASTAAAILAGLAAGGSAGLWVVCGMAW